MAWNFRFSTVNKNAMPPTMVLSQHPHLDINTWLEMLDLAQYNGKQNTILSIICIHDASKHVYCILKFIFRFIFHITTE